MILKDHTKVVMNLFKEQPLQIGEGSKGGTLLLCCVP